MKKNTGDLLIFVDKIISIAGRKRGLRRRKGQNIVRAVPFKKRKVTA